MAGRLGCEANVDAVAKEKPDLVVIITGARAFKPSIPDIDDYGYNAWEVLQGALVIDEEYGHQAPSVAEFLLDRGKQVEIVTSEASIATFMGATTRPSVLQRLYSKQAKIHGYLKVVALESNRAIALNVWSNREETLEPFDAFVYAYGGQSVDELSKSLSAQAPKIELIGDAFAPRTIQHAILEGHKLARAI